MDIMSKLDIKSKGICLNRHDIGFSGEYGEQMSFILSDGTTKPITGLAYEEYENGEIRSYCHYIDGILNGEVVNFFESGLVGMVANMLNGTIVGKKMMWYENGNLKLESEGKYGIELFRREWDADGKLIREKLCPSAFELKLLKKYEGETAHSEDTD